MKNCVCCGASYTPYKIEDRDTEVLGYWCEVPNPKAETKGNCAFCNPNSSLYNHKETHSKQTCRI